MPNISCYNVICTENNGALGLQAIFEIIEVMIGKSPNKYFLKDIGVNPYTHFRNAPHAILPILFFRPLPV